MKLHSLSIALILFSIGQIMIESTFAQSVLTQNQVAPDEIQQIDAEPVGAETIESREKREERKRNREDRRHPDNDVDLGENIVPPPVNPDVLIPVDPEEQATIEPVEGREERERRRREREERQREQEEYERTHPKPDRGGGGLFGFVGWIFWAVFGVFLWPFSLILNLVKWGGILMLLFVAFTVFCIAVVLGLYGCRMACWAWGLVVKAVGSATPAPPTPLKADPPSVKQARADEVRRRMMTETPEDWGNRFP